MQLYDTMWSAILHRNGSVSDTQESIVRGSGLTGWTYLAYDSDVHNNKLCKSSFGSSLHLKCVCSENKVKVFFDTPKMALLKSSADIIIRDVLTKGNRSFILNDGSWSLG